ncbi:hypothetical protein ACOI1H_21440 [Loktanella sp. DJP18]|uniref:hypothetical protein n=1 Tax=Loktanella sp. DJP18 TaxID=3409788 RepID=UPI003BB6979B
MSDRDIVRHVAITGDSDGTSISYLLLDTALWELLDFDTAFKTLWDGGDAFQRIDALPDLITEIGLNGYTIEGEMFLTAY